MDVVTCIPRFGADYRIDAFVNQIEATVSGLIDELASIQTRKVVNKRQATPWLSKEAMSAKKNRRKLEWRWKKTKSQQSFIEYRKACRRTNHMITSSRQKYYSESIETADNPQRRWTTIKNLLHPQSAPSHVPSNDTGVHFSSISPHSS